MSRLVSKTVLAVALVVGLALVACRPQMTQQHPGEDRLLETLMEDYVGERFRFYPVESTLAGLPGNDDRLGSFSRDDVEGRIAWLADFHKKLIGLRLDALSEPAYLDALWLTSLVKAEILDLEERRVWEKNARFYVEPVVTGLTSLLLDPDVSSRTGALAGRLDAIPTLFDQARENLNPGAGLWRADSLAALELCRALLADLPQLLTERVPAYRVAELAERSRLATRSLQVLASRLESPEAREEEVVEWTPLGLSTLERYFLYSEMVDASADEILADARAALERRTDELLALGLEAFSGEPMEQLVERREPPDDVRAVVESTEERARAFAQRLGRPFPLARPIPVVSVAPYFVAPEVVRLFRPAALEPGKGAFLLVDIASGADAHVLRLRTLGEVVARYRLYAFQSESTSLLRRVVSTRTTEEGFRAWTVTRLLELGYAEDEPELRLRDQHAAVLELVRLIATIELHRGDATLAAVEQFFRTEGFLDPEAARLEAARVALDPAPAIPGLGRLQLIRLVRDYYRANPLATEAELVEALLAEGPLPLRLVRLKLLGIDP